MNRVKQILTRLGMVAVATTVALLIVEGILRLGHLAATDGVATVTEREFRQVPGIFAPDQDLVERREPALPYHVTTDSLGYRGKNFPRSKEPGEFRVLFTGDSFVFGDFVDDDQTLPAQLELRLRARCGLVRVVNAGVGDGTIVEETHMIDRALSLAPDLVMLLFSENDIDDLNRIATWDRLADNRRAKSHFPLSILYPILRRTALWNLGIVARAHERAREHPVNIDWSVQRRADSITARLREQYRRALVAMRDTLGVHGIPLVFVAYPSHHAVLETRMRGQMTWVSSMSGDARIALVNLLTPLVASGLRAEQLYLLPRDGHPSPEGYRISATYLADRLTTVSPLTSRCETIAVHPHSGAQVASGGH